LSGRAPFIEREDLAAKAQAIIQVSFGEWADAQARCFKDFDAHFGMPQLRK